MSLALALFSSPLLGAPVPCLDAQADLRVVDGTDPWSELIRHYSETACSYEVEFTCLFIRNEAMESSAEASGLLAAYSSEGLGGADLGYSALSEMCSTLVTTQAEGVHVVPGVSYRVTRHGAVTLQEGLHEPAINEVRTPELLISYTSPLGHLTVARNESRVALNTPETLLRPMPKNENVPSWLHGTWESFEDACYQKPQARAGPKTTVRFMPSSTAWTPVAFWTRSSPVPYHLSAGFYGWGRSITEDESSPSRPIGSIQISRSEKALSVFWYRVTGYTEDVEPHQATLVICEPTSIVDTRGGESKSLPNIQSLPDEVRRMILVLDEEEEADHATSGDK